MIAPDEARDRLGDGDRLPDLVTDVPGPASRALAERAARHEPAPSVGVVDGGVPVGWVAARGANVVDPDGNRLVDLTGGFGAAAVGHADPRVVEAARDASERLLHGLGDAAPHPDRVAVAETLSARGPVPGGTVHFTASGAEAVDLALKTAHLATGRIGVLAFEGGYHGTSLGALRATSRAAFRWPFDDALADATLRVPYADCFRCPYRLRHPACGLACLDAAMLEVDGWNGDPDRPRLGAVVVEPVLGREGIVVPPEGWLARLGEEARRRDLVVIADEILTGGGRTGSWWASGPLEPDLATVGKGITGGAPIAAVVGRPDLMAAWETAGEARHTITFLAHPPAVAAARAAIEEIDRRDLPARARALGERLSAGLRSIADSRPAIGHVRGVGAMWAIDVVADRATRTPDPAAATALSRGLAARGYLALAGGPAGNVVTLTPPLTIADPQVDGFLEALEVALNPESPVGV